MKKIYILILLMMCMVMTSCAGVVTDDTVYVAPAYVTPSDRFVIGTVVGTAAAVVAWDFYWTIVNDRYVRVPCDRYYSRYPHYSRHPHYRYHHRNRVFSNHIYYEPPRIRNYHHPRPHHYPRTIHHR